MQAQDCLLAEEDQKLPFTGHVVYRIYGRTDYGKPVKPECIIVEDSNAGYEFYAGLSEKGKYSVISAGGKSNIFGKLIANQNNSVLIIADGAAFGPEMDRIMKIVSRKEGFVLYLPESFEWLILKSGIIAGKDLLTILENPEDVIESSEFFSWERFFTNLLVTMTQDTYLQYTKRKLNQAYLDKDRSVKIVQQMKSINLFAKE